jgi:hypothetical protein
MKGSLGVGVWFRHFAAQALAARRLSTKIRLVTDILVKQSGANGALKLSRQAPASSGGE